MIPARLESSRLKEKALIDIEGLPMVMHTCKRALLAKSLKDVFLVTDSDEIKAKAIKHGIKYLMTGKHISSSDRLAEACQNIECDIIVNIQGDEPLVNPDHIDEIVKPLLLDNNIEMSVGITTFAKKKSYADIKVVTDFEDNILYMSRNDIPYDYKGFTNNSMKKLCTIVPYRKETLINFSRWEESNLELIEDNHLLRFLENGVKIKTVEVDDGKISVDTLEDLEEVKELMTLDKIKHFYIKE